MEYQIELTENARKEDLPKLKKYGINFETLDRQFRKISTNPYICSAAKSGNLSDYRAVKWGSVYRILNPDITKDKHDDAYKKAKRRK